MLHIKLKGMTNAATGSKYFAGRPPEPGEGVKRSELKLFSEYGHVAYQNKWKGT